MTFGVNSSYNRSHMTTTNHNFISSDFLSIATLGSSLFIPQNRQYVYLQVERIFCYNKRISDMIWDNKREQKSDDKGLEWW